jgi:hypothetical protein
MVAVAVAVQAPRGVAVTRPAQELCLLETAAALRRTQVAAAAVVVVWCSANTLTALWSQAKQGQAAQARLAPYTSSMWANG